ncbi:MAG: rRNA maturation RNase YbeY [Patescibacteria group bacterium]|nr:rRNA maturation RNase YbeY [Patescibacteria group bacterium]
MIINISGKVPRVIKEDQIKKAVRKTFTAARRIERGSLSIRFVGEQEMEELNQCYRKIKGSTNVLAFSADASFPQNSVDWGDIMVASDYVKRDVEDREIPFTEELVRLISHGTLHLLGYDHDTKAKEKRMFGLQESVVRKITNY